MSSKDYTVIKSVTVLAHTIFNLISATGATKMETKIGVAYTGI